MILDDTDRRLLRLLATDADMPTTQIARRLGLSQPATWRRIRWLEQTGILGTVSLISISRRWGSASRSFWA